MKHLSMLYGLAVVLVVASCTPEESLTVVDTEITPLTTQAKAGKTVIHQTAEVGMFMPAGELGGDGNVLEPGTWYPPQHKGTVKLKRTADYLQVNIQTSGLPMGAYTFWWVIFNDPDACTAGAGPIACGEPDLFLAKTGIVWGSGKMVQANGVGVFSDRLYVGERRMPGVQEALLGEDLMDHGALLDPLGAEVHIIIKYHGLASDDPDMRWAQLNTLLGSCGENEGANSFDAGPVFGIQCFDPQLALFPAP